MDALRFLCAVCAIFFSTYSFSQDCGCGAATPNIVDPAPYSKIHTISSTPVAYEYVREADVMWAKRIWRVIDLSEKMNLPLKYPASHTSRERCSLIDVIMDAVLSGCLTAYSTLDDEFTDALNKEEIEAMITRTDTMSVPSPDPPYEMVQQVVKTTLDRDKVVEYRLKEDWFFDKQRSVMQVRIVGMAPVINDFDDQGNLRGKKPLFWVYFPEARTLLAKVEYFNRWNDAQRLSMDDVFQIRFFSSYIIKESNVYDRRIQDYKIGMDALHEAQRIKEEIFNFEHDLWEF